MASELQDNLNTILQEKTTKIIPENIKKDVQIFDVVGTLEAGIDTSDATATSTDIAAGKTAYANNEKITGIIKEYIENEKGLCVSHYDSTFMPDQCKAALHDIATDSIPPYFNDTLFLQVYFLEDVLQRKGSLLMFPSTQLAYFIRPYSR